jgi:hypothetical protein
MMHDELDYPTRATRRVQYSVGGMLMLMTMVAVVLSIAILFGKIRRLESRLAATEGMLQSGSAVNGMPISAQAVAQQFEQATSVRKVTTKVDDVRYSRSNDAFQVSFSWNDPASKSRWSSQVVLESDGFGTYFGPIRSSEFLKAIGSNNDSYMIAVQSKSPMQR